MMAVGFVAATVLTTLLLVATLLHWELFNHRHVSFWAWLVIYAVTPVLLPVLWMRNRSHDPGLDGHTGGIVPVGIRMAVGTLGTVQLVIALAFFVHPPLADVWPWPLTPLTVRTISAFIAFIAVMLMAFFIERRWSALRLLVDSAVLGLALVLIGVVRAWDDLTGSTLENGLFVAVLGGAAVALGAVRLTVKDGSTDERGATT